MITICQRLKKTRRSLVGNLLTWPTNHSIFSEISNIGTFDIFAISLTFVFQIWTDCHLIYPLSNIKLLINRFMMDHSSKICGWFWFKIKQLNGWQICHLIVVDYLRKSRLKWFLCFQNNLTNDFNGVGGWFIGGNLNYCPGVRMHVRKWGTWLQIQYVKLK